MTGFLIVLLALLLIHTNFYQKVCVDSIGDYISKNIFMSVELNGYLRLTLLLFATVIAFLLHSVIAGMHSKIIFALYSLLVLAISLFTSIVSYKSSYATLEHLKVFTPLFWFAVLGPLGGLIVIIINIANSIFKIESRVISVTLTWLRYIPSIISGAIFALVGDFNPAWKILIKNVKIFNVSSDIVHDCCTEALGQTTSIDEIDLVNRARIVWFIFAAFLAALFWNF